MNREFVNIINLIVTLENLLILKNDLKIDEYNSHVICTSIYDGSFNHIISALNENTFI